MTIILSSIAILVLLFLLWREWRRNRATLAAMAQLGRRAAAAERDAGENLRLLRAAGSELREQALALLGQAEICAQAEAVEWAAIAARLLAMADDMQDHAPPSPESRVLARELIAAKPLIARCVDAVAANLRPSLRMWKLAPELNELQLHGDPRALAQILLRVLSNAARSTRHLDWIEIGVEHVAGQVVLTVQDEGNGLLIPSVYQPDDQPGDSRGVGLGLAVARSLVRAHGGDLNVDSVPGVGARVEVALPQLRTA